MIAQQTGMNCVNRAFSIMRLALGYNEAIPDFAIDGPKTPADILSAAGHWFPEHTVDVMCAPDQAMKAVNVPRNCTYTGTGVPDSNEYWDAHLSAFSYYVGENDDAHFVIGTPCLYDSMKTSVVVAVEIQ